LRFEREDAIKDWLLEVLVHILLQLVDGAFLGEGIDACGKVGVAVVWLCLSAEAIEVADFEL
jgi:hypothetical protein